MDKYDASNDHYCYRETGTLKNKFNHFDQNELEEAEKKITASAVKKIEFQPPPYDLEYLKLLHSKLFSCLYEWAGELRNVNITKGNIPFCNCELITAETQKLFSKLQKENWLANLKKDEFCEKLAKHYCEFNMIHPFREGNGRTQRLLFEHLTLAASYDLDWNIQRDEWIQASIDGVDKNYKLMEQIFKRIVSCR